MRKLTSSHIQWLFKAYKQGHSVLDVGRVLQINEADLARFITVNLVVYQRKLLS